MSLDMPVLLVIHRRPAATRRVFDAIARRGHGGCSLPRTALQRLKIARPVR